MSNIRFDGISVGCIVTRRFSNTKSKIILITDIRFNHDIKQYEAIGYPILYSNNGINDAFYIKNVSIGNNPPRDVYVDIHSKEVFTKDDMKQISFSGVAYHKMLIDLFSYIKEVNKETTDFEKLDCNGYTYIPKIGGIYKLSFTDISAIFIVTKLPYKSQDIDQECYPQVFGYLYFPTVDIFEYTAVPLLWFQEYDIDSKLIDTIQDSECLDLLVNLSIPHFRLNGLPSLLPNTAIADIGWIVSKEKLM